MRDVAKAAGVCKTTVAAALTTRTSISPATRKRVLEAAKKLGYKPDPLLSSLARNRWKTIQTKATYAMAFIVSSSLQLRDSLWDLAFQEARKEADKLGYALERYNVQDYDSAEHLGRILHARGVRGLLISYLFRLPPQPDFDWNMFSAISLGEGPYTPPIHRVNVAYFQDSLSAWKKTIDAGYRKIGGVLQIHEPVLGDDSQRMGALANAQQLYLQPSERIPPFFYGTTDLENPMPIKELSGKYEEWFTQFSQWFEKYQPEAIIASNPLAAWWVQRLGKQIPNDVAFVTLEKGRNDARTDKFAGFFSAKQEFSKIAIPVLDMLVQTNQTGLPENIQCICYFEKWQSGASLPKKIVLP